MGHSWPCLSWRTGLQHWVLTEPPPPTRRCLTVIGHLALARELCSLGVFICKSPGGWPASADVPVPQTALHTESHWWGQAAFPTTFLPGEAAVLLPAPWFEVMP